MNGAISRAGGARERGGAMAGRSIDPSTAPRAVRSPGSYRARGGRAWVVAQIIVLISRAIESSRIRSSDRARAGCFLFLFFFF